MPEVRAYVQETVITEAAGAKQESGSNGTLQQNCFDGCVAAASDSQDSSKVLLHFMCTD